MTEEKYLLKFDEIEKLSREYVINESEAESLEEFEDLLIDAYLSGFEFAKDMLGEDVEIPIRNDFLNHSYDGKTVGEKFQTYYQSEDEESIKRLAQSEYHRTFNKGLDDYSNEYEKNFGKVKKTWKTMDDDKVRETHIFLDGVSVNEDESFHTIDGDSALRPGEFEFAQNNANCRCYLILTKS